MHVKAVRIVHERYPTRDRHPYDLQVLQATRQLELNWPVTCFIGENGTGKSTLLRALCRRCGVHIWQRPEDTRLEANPYEDTFQHMLDVDWTTGPVPGSFFGSEVFRDFTHLLEEWACEDPGQLQYFGGRSLITQSHGESLMSYFRARYRIKGLYFLDEPETALSARTQLALLRLIMETSAAGHAQFVIATHSPILMACPGARIYSFDASPVRPIPYAEVEQVRLYRDFLNNPTPFLGAN
ncbi:MAG: AAA family ATPase [Gemmatimonadota bacterium]